MLNTPYVKEYKNGILQNPIKKEFKNEFPNRSERRMSLGISKQKRLFRNKRNCPTIISRVGVLSFVKYHPVIQRVDGKVIIH